MLKKTYGLVYRNGKWYVRNYGRPLKKGGLYGIQAHMMAWWNNRTGETPIIELKRIVPQPWAQEDDPDHEMIKELMGSSRPMKVSYDDPAHNRT